MRILENFKKITINNEFFFCVFDMKPRRLGTIDKNIAKKA